MTEMPTLVPIYLFYSCLSCGYCLYFLKLYFFTNLEKTECCIAQSYLSVMPMLFVWNMSLPLMECQRSCQIFCSTTNYKVGAVLGAALCTHVLYSCLVSSLSADPLAVLFTHVVKSWKSTNTRNLWLGMPEPLPETGVLVNQKRRKIYTPTDWHTEKCLIGRSSPP